MLTEAQMLYRGTMAGHVESLSPQRSPAPSRFVAAWAGVWSGSCLKMSEAVALSG